MEFQLGINKTVFSFYNVSGFEIYVIFRVFSTFLSSIIFIKIIFNEKKLIAVGFKITLKLIIRIGYT